MRRLNAIAFKDVIEQLAEHAIESGLTPLAVSHHVAKRYLEIALDVYGGQCAVAAHLGVHRNTLSKWIRLYGVEVRGPKAANGNRGAKRVA